VHLVRPLHSAGRQCLPSVVWQQTSASNCLQACDMVMLPANPPVILWTSFHMLSTLTDGYVEPADAGSGSTLARRRTVDADLRHLAKLSQLNLTDRLGDDPKTLYLLPTTALLPPKLAAFTWSGQLWYHVVGPTAGPHRQPAACADCCAEASLSATHGMWVQTLGIWQHCCVGCSNTRGAHVPKLDLQLQFEDDCSSSQVNSRAGC
jgi:hypothetical protein